MEIYSMKWKIEITEAEKDQLIKELIKILNGKQTSYPALDILRSELEEL